MNKSYRSIWNESLGAWVAASEITTGRGKPSHSRVRAGGAEGKSGWRVRAAVSGALMALAGGLAVPAWAEVTQNFVLGATCNRPNSTDSWSCTVSNGDGGTAIFAGIADDAGNPNWTVLQGFIDNNLGTNAIALGNGAKAANLNGIAIG